MEIKFTVANFVKFATKRLPDALVKNGATIEHLDSSKRVLSFSDTDSTLMHTHECISLHSKKAATQNYSLYLLLESTEGQQSVRCHVSDNAGICILQHICTTMDNLRTTLRILNALQRAQEHLGAESYDQIMSDILRSQDTLAANNLNTLRRLAESLMVASERNLHKMLAEFLMTHATLVARGIYHETSVFDLWVQQPNKDHIQILIKPRTGTSGISDFVTGLSTDQEDDVYAHDKMRFFLRYDLSTNKLYWPLRDHVSFGFLFKDGDEYMEIPGIIPLPVDGAIGAALKPIYHCWKYQGPAFLLEQFEHYYQEQLGSSSLIVPEFVESLTIAIDEYNDREDDEAEEVDSFDNESYD